MDQKRWKTVNHIFHAALEVSLSERHAFVHSASNGDPDLQAEVEVLLKADQDAGTYLETPLLPGELFSGTTPTVSPGDVLCGRFRILRAVGEGGMGHVFEAFDSELAVHVALKIIRPEIASNPETLNRFRQEVRLARQITHPNVCRTFDIERETSVADPGSGTKKELIFLTMELLQGETLESRIKRSGLLPLDEALQIATQIADALFAAHSFGIVHRDMKPANIMLVPAEIASDSSFRAVITDFGLARIDTAFPQGIHSPLSHSGRPIGTLSYMAPEQLEGKGVSAATDIYAFGLILFEMVTGTRAFPTDNFLSGIAERLSDPPPSPSAIVPDLPASWCRAIDGCLRLTPVNRFHSATDVVAVLEGRRTNLPRAIKSTFLQRFALVSWHSRRRFFAFSGVLCAAVALFFGGYRLDQLRADSKVNSGALVYLTRVKNLTGERTLDNLTELLQAGLNQSAQINLLDRSQVGNTLQLMTKPPDTVIDPPTAREIALRTGAVRVVFATLTGSAGSYRLNIDIQQPDAYSLGRPRDHWSNYFTWTASSSTANSPTIPPDLLSAVRKSTNWIRYEVGESKNDIARLDTPPEDVTTSNWQALEDYCTAESFYERGKKEEAIAAFNQATLHDPEFALAYARIGDLAVSLGQTRAGYKAYLQALSTDLDRRLTRRELDRIRGIYASDGWDYQSAEAAFHDYTIYYDGDYTGWFFRALPLMRLQRIEEAISTLQRAYLLDPHRPSAPYDLAICYILLGDRDNARHWTEIIRQLSQTELAAQLDGILAFLDGHDSGSETSFVSMRTSRTPMFRLRAYSYLTRLEAERGEYTKALAWASNGVKEAGEDGNNAQRAAFLMDRAHIYCRLAQFAPCLEQAKEALILDDSPELIFFATEVYGNGARRSTGIFSQQFRDALSSLIRLIPDNMQNASYTLASMQIKAEIQLANGKIDSALAEARKASAIDVQFRRRELLARILVAAAAKASNANQRRAYLMEARQAYAPTALDPSAVWSQPTLYLPGTLAEDVNGYISLSNQIPLQDGGLSKAVAMKKRMHLESAPMSSMR